MALTYTLLVDKAETFTGTFPDARSLASDAVSRAASSARHSVSIDELTEDIERGFRTIDLSTTNPMITVRVKAA
ncbi:hypothetical protein C1S80_12540 [Mycolicibacterium aubagnense]|nr:hypothetical protein C1S80_12540 [Mycolicibacterium aubagnense]